MAAMAIVGVLSAVACGGQTQTSTPAGNGVNFVSGNGNSAYYPAASRPVAPSVSGSTLSGGRAQPEFLSRPGGGR